MKLYIPTIGDEIILDEDWTFTLHNEHRNESLFYFLGIEKEIYTKFNAWDTNRPFEVFSFKTQEVKLPKNTKLIIDRIYIRNNQKEFDSITFKMSKDVKATIPRSNIRPKRITPRFWVRLSDANKIKIKELAFDTDSKF